MLFVSVNNTRLVCFLISNSYTSGSIQCIKRIWDARLVGTCYMEIDACRLDVVVSQQLLYGSQVRSLLQQVCGKGVAKHVYVYPMLDAGTVGGFFQHLCQCACRVLPAGSISFKKPSLRTVFLKIFPKLVQHLFRQQRVAAFLSLAHNTDQHPFTDNVLWGEVKPGSYILLTLPTSYAVYSSGGP